VEDYAWLVEQTVGRYVPDEQPMQLAIAVTLVFCAMAST